jgi:hypothetical protein
MDETEMNERKKEKCKMRKRKIQIEIKALWEQINKENKQSDTLMNTAGQSERMCERKTKDARKRARRKKK